MLLKCQYPVFFMHHPDHRVLKPCLDPKNFWQKISHHKFEHMHGVLNEVYLQNFVHKWVVNREMNLMSLLNL